MSYDSYIQIDTGSPDGPAVVEEIGNMTSNVAAIWARGLAHATGNPEAWLSDWSYEHAIACSDAAPILEKACAYIEDPANEADLKKLEPSNGWGSLGRAREYLRRIEKACRKHPKATLYISS